MYLCNRKIKFVLQDSKGYNKVSPKRRQILAPYNSGLIQNGIILEVITHGLTGLLAKIQKNTPSSHNMSALTLSGEEAKQITAKY